MRIMNDYELSRLWTGQPPRTSEDNPRVTAKDYGTMPTAEFVEGVFSTNDRDASRDVLVSVIERLAGEHLEARRRGDFFRDALADACGCPPSPVEVACQEGDPCPFISDDDYYTDYAACWDEVERRQR